ncbi:tripartite tricarboxylate transporter TctB family protein [Mycobacterium neglectum]|uniref:tripartite tricarboxylate transporter TctB family protein n=1 Tax=Mycobacterium neglectum TaxID=242737 RepID=UPI000BFEACD8|nr:tripartite tricarboxylate transporter TctB family protein [Mycobacterium neglectum]
MSKSVGAWLPGGIVTLLGLGFTVGGLAYGLTDDGRMAPGLMPTVMGVGIVVFGVLLVVSDLRSVSQNKDGPIGDTAEVAARMPVRVGGSDVPASPDPSVVAGTEEADLAEREAKHPLRPWFIFAAMVGSLLLAPYAGLIPALVLGGFVMMKFVERESWVASVSVSALLLVASWFIFDDFLEVNLPWGVFAGVM